MRLPTNEEINVKIILGDLWAEMFEPKFNDYDHLRYGDREAYGNFLREYGVITVMKY